MISRMIQLSNNIYLNFLKNIYFYICAGISLQWERSVGTQISQLGSNSSLNTFKSAHGEVMPKAGFVRSLRLLGRRRRGLGLHLEHLVAQARASGGARWVARRAARAAATPGGTQGGGHGQRRVGHSDDVGAT